MITDVPGVRVGHWTHPSARTGCTVVLLPDGSVGSAEVRGGAPASRELELLHPERRVARVDAVVLSGGSAFGLAAADGVMQWCEARGIGFPTMAGPVPIVPTMALFDLNVGDATVRPGPAEGRAACEAATDGTIELGAVGAGAGATIGKWRGADARRQGGLVSASVRVGPAVVSTLVAVNAFGDVDPDGPGLAAALERLTEEGRDPSVTDAAPVGVNTTIGVVATNVRLDKVGCLVVAQGAHDALSRVIVPAHTRVDGDAFVAVSTGEIDPDEVRIDIDAVRLLAVAVVDRAVRSLAPA